jgi:hypothetical protein
MIKEKLNQKKFFFKFSVKQTFQKKHIFIQTTNKIKKFLETKNLKIGIEFANQFFSLLI